jgi:hypothetical protein
MKAGVLGFVQHGSLYPALRARPSTQRSPTRLLEELGSPHNAVARADSDYEHAAAGLFPKLLDRAQDARQQEQVGEAPGSPISRPTLFEYRHASRHLDDVFRNAAFWVFSIVHRRPFLHIGNVGALRKPE